MKTYFEPKLDGIDESFSNMVIESTRTATDLKTTTYVRPTMTYASATQLTSPTASAPKTTTVSPTTTSFTSMPKTTTTTTVISPTPKTTSIPTSSSTPSVPVAPTSTPSMDMPSVGGGFGGSVMGGSEESIPSQSQDSLKKGGLSDGYISGIKKNYAYGIGLLILGSFVYFKYIKK